MVTGFALAPSRVVVLAPGVSRSCRNWFSKPPRQSIVFLERRRLRASWSRNSLRSASSAACAARRDHVGEHVENLAQRSDRDIKQATAAMTPWPGNASHVAKGAKRAWDARRELVRDMRSY